MKLITMHSVRSPSVESVTGTAGSVFPVKTPPWWTIHNDSDLSAGEPEPTL